MVNHFQITEGGNGVQLVFVSCQGAKEEWSRPWKPIHQPEDPLVAFERSAQGQFTEAQQNT